MKKGISVIEILVTIFIICLIIFSFKFEYGKYVGYFFIALIFLSMMTFIFEIYDNKKQERKINKDLNIVNDKESLLYFLKKYNNDEFLFFKNKNKLEIKIKNVHCLSKKHSIDYLEEYGTFLKIIELDELYNFDINESKENKVKRILKIVIINNFMNLLDKIKLENNIVDIIPLDSNINDFLLDNSQIMDSFDVYEILEELFEVLDIDFENKSEISLNDILNQIEDEKPLNEFLEKESQNYNK